MEVAKCRLIEEIRKRPLLWDFRNFYEARNNKKIDKLWQEISIVLGSEVASCKLSWKKLRTAFFNELKRIPIRIANAQRKGTYDASKKYKHWPYFDTVKFIASGRSVRGMKKQCLQVFTDIKIIANNNSEPQEEKQTCKNFKSYTMAVYTEDSECNTNSNNKINLPHMVLLNDSLLKEETKCEIQVDKIFSDTEDIKNSNVSKPEPILGSENPKALDGPKKCEKYNQNHSAFLENKILSSVDYSDQDYNFLYSVLAQMKQMSHLQKLQFRAKMSSLILDIFSPSSPVKDLDKRVLSSGNNDDPDTKFLISFLPFLKSMSLTQNSIFRNKIVDLLLNILPTAL